MLETPLLEKFLDFLVSWFSVSWFLGFVVSWFLGSLVSKFQGFTKFPFRVFDEIDLISKLFKILLQGSSGFPGALLFENRQAIGFPTT